MKKIGRVQIVPSEKAQRWPSLPAGRRLFEEGWIGGTGWLRRPSKPTHRDESPGARTAEGFSLWERSKGYWIHYLIIKDTGGLWP